MTPLRAAVESATPAAGASTYPVVVDAPTGAPGLVVIEPGGPVRPTSVSRPFVASGGSYGYDSCPNCAPGYDCERGVYARMGGGA